MKDLSKMKQHHRLKDLKFGEPDSISELERGIVLPKHFAQGPWYKCSKGIWNLNEKGNDFSRRGEAILLEKLKDNS